jgi:hypothetical protein
MAAVLARPRAELDRRTMATRSPFRRRSERRRAAIRAAVREDAALPELGAMAAVLARTTGPSWARRRLAPRCQLRRRSEMAPRCPNWARRLWRRVVSSALLHVPASEHSTGLAGERGCRRVPSASRQAGTRAGFTGRPGGVAGDDLELAQWWRGGRHGLQLRRGGAAIGSGGAGRGPGVAPAVAPEKVPLKFRCQPRISAAPATWPTIPPRRTAVDPLARIGPWLPVCTLADLLARFARGLDTRRCPVSLLTGSSWAVR